MAGRLMDLGIAGLTFEVPFVINFKQNVNFDLNLVPKDYKSFFVTPAIRANLFPDSRAFALGKCGRRIRPFH